MNEWIVPEKIKPEQRDLGSLPYLKAQLQEMNAGFVAAMAAAIRAGLERPPRIGIDRVPGTKNPSYVPYGATGEL